MGREARDRASHLLGGFRSRSMWLSCSAVSSASASGSVASSLPPTDLRAMFRATPHSHAASVPRSGSYWFGRVMKNTKVSWVASAAFAVDPE